MKKLYLKNIYAYGFKSFADKTNIDVEKGITCIVGPNGSGKSNIVDAIRWVLGEQSIKSLRGSSSMTDVIFTGSNSRSAQNRAVVALTFNNSDHYLNSDFSEIEVKRVVYNSGETEYYLNNSKVRLKDITDLFIDSGASKESFNIISQGSIADVINSKPEDRRVIFEEAAGVLKYKKRKEESLKKLLKTKDNLDKVELLINELKDSVEPLKEQSILATRYLEIKTKLENIEIALIVNDITFFNNEYQQNQTLLKEVNEDLLKISNSNNSDNSEIEKVRLAILKNDEALTKINEALVDIDAQLVDLATKKQINIERQKYEYDDHKLQSNIIYLHEQELQVANNIKSYDLDLQKLNDELKNQQMKLAEKNEANVHHQVKLNQLKTKLFSLNKEKSNLANQIEIKKNNIETDSLIPSAVKSIISNPRLNGICGYLAKLITVSEDYTVALETSLGANASTIVVENEAATKKAIEYLKDNNLGRATFFPLNIIKPRYIDQETLNLIKNENGYIGILGDLVNYEPKYKPIILNQVGNVIVVDQIETMNKIGRLINYKYRIVTLDGEIQYSGGAITGGNHKKNSSLISQKFELERLEKELKNLDSEEIAGTKELESLINNINQAHQTEENINKEIIILTEKIAQKNLLRKEIVIKHQEIVNEISGTQGVKNNKIEKDVAKIIDDYYHKVSEKQQKEKELSYLKQQKNDYNNELNDLEKKYRNYNIDYNRLLNEQKNLEVKIGRFEVKLDNLLLSLNEDYSITYEKAQNNYHLEISSDLARETVNKYKNEIKQLGNVNLGSIAEYERISKRYNFLTTQKEDLNKAILTLNEIIAEMDEIMKDKFLNSFNKVSEQFQITFKKLFKGGKGILKLTNPENILETGIDIIAEPPGKKLNSIALLSNGEKTLTAMALLFSILIIKPAPFCVLDEVEAALDDVNVATFGDYLLEYKSSNQFIIITHKKKTMEYADILYGITMQESGVSKLVSVKLEN